MFNIFKITKVILAVVLQFFLTNSAIALDVQQYEESKEKHYQLLKIHMLGLGEGYMWSNVLLEMRGDEAFYCPPQKITLNAENYIAIIDEQILKVKKTGKASVLPVELMLFTGLAESFPCSK